MLNAIARLRALPHIWSVARDQGLASVGVCLRFAKGSFRPRSVDEGNLAVYLIAECIEGAQPSAVLAAVKGLKAEHLPD